MAYLKKITNSAGKGYYYSRITYVKWSKAKMVSLNTNSKVAARVRHSEVERNEKDIKIGMDISFSWENDECRTQVKQMTYAEGIKQWLVIKEINVSKGSYKRYAISLNAFMNIVGDVTPLSSVTNQNIEDFKKYYSKFHTPCGININLRGIKAFLRWSYEEGLIEKMPKIQTMKEPKEKPKYITEKNWRDLMDLDSLSNWWKDLFRMYVTTGMRRSEALLGYIDGSFLIVPAIEGNKARRETEIELNDFQLNVIKALHKERDKHLAKGNKMVTFEDKLTKKFTYACKNIGIYVPRKTTLHCLRHTFAVKKYLETRDLYEVCKRLNHDKLSTTQIYSKFSWSRLEQDFPTLMEHDSKTAKIANRETDNRETPPLNNYIIPRQMN